MKTQIAVTLLLASSLIIGCAPARDPKTAELEKRLTALEYQVAGFNARLTNHNALVLDTVGTLREGLSNVNSLRLQTAVALALMSEHIDKAEQWMATNRPPMRYFPVAAGKVTAQTSASNGVPTPVYNQILADAQQQWPGNYDMQDFRVRQQIEAYRKLNPGAR